MRDARRDRRARVVAWIALFVSVVVAGLLLAAAPAGRAAAAPIPAPEPIAPIEIPGIPDADTVIVPIDTSTRNRDDDTATDSTTIGVALPDVTGDSSNVVVIILLLSVLSIAPSILILTTSFTRIVIVLSLTRNALGIPQLPPQQVIVGLSIFLTLFVMGPTLETLNENALQPLLNGEATMSEAYDAAEGPLREFMLQSTREGELKLFLDASEVDGPIARDEVPLKALIPAFVLSELKSAFILGFIIFVPFMVLDLVVSAVLTSLGMMMLPPTFVSLPLKLLLFILLDGWTLIIGTLLTSYG